MTSHRAAEWNVWVQDMDWTVPDPGDERTCRFPRCGAPAVAILWRRRRNGLPTAWRYCPDHMYGRKVIAGVVHVRVHPDSPSARRGYSMLLNEQSNV